MIIIVGMHRSGTTMLARLFQTAGVNMGPLKDNNFESRLYAWDIMNYQNFLQGTWDHPYSMRRPVESQRYMNGKKKFLLNLIRRKKFHQCISLGRLVGFKHPVASLLIPELSKLQGARFVRINRNKDSVTKSLVRRPVPAKSSWFPGRISGGVLMDCEAEAGKLYDFYNAQLDQYQNLMDLTLDYEKLLSQVSRNTELSKISRFLGVNEIKAPNSFFGDKTNG